MSRVKLVVYGLQVVLQSAKCVADVQPDFDVIARCPGDGIVVTGIAPPDSGFDFHSRYFCPKHKINEVTVSMLVQM